MPFQYILADLVGRTEDAVAALFVDDQGETIEVACSEASPESMRLVGAYLGIIWTQIGRLFSRTRLGDPKQFHIERDNLHIYSREVRDGYFLVLVQRRPALTSVARRRLAAAARQLERELFPV